jgi:ketosteroid isomerase-like protein
MAQRNVEIVREHFAATNERDFERAMSYYADDVELIVPRGEGGVEVGTFRGRESVGEWFGDWLRSFEPGYRFEIEKAVDLGDAVLVLTSHSGRGRASGAEIHGKRANIYGLRSGKIVSVELFASHAEALEAARLRA